MEQLKPCPFCGGEVKTIYYYDGIGTEYFGVHCERCRFTYGAETEYKRNTVNRWNSRMTDWIKTSERLPEMCKDVLVFSDNGEIFVGFIDMPDDGLLVWRVCEHFARNRPFKLEKYPYWMPLPEPPEVENEL